MAKLLFILVSPFINLAANQGLKKKERKKNKNNLRNHTASRVPASGRCGFIDIPAWFVPWFMSCGLWATEPGESRSGQRVKVGISTFRMQRVNLNFLLCCFRVLKYPFLCLDTTHCEDSILLRLPRESCRIYSQASSRWSQGNPGMYNVWSNYMVNVYTPINLLQYEILHKAPQYPPLHFLCTHPIILAAALEPLSWIFKRWDQTYGPYNWQAPPLWKGRLVNMWHCVLTILFTESGMVQLLALP